MGVRQRGKSWQVERVHNGKRFRRSLPTQEQALALDEQLDLAIQRDENLEVAFGKFLGKAGMALVLNTQRTPSNAPATLGQLLQKVYELHWIGARSANQIKINLKDVEKLLGPELPLRFLDIVKNPNAVEWIDVLVTKLKGQGHNNGNGTINRKLAVLSKALSFAQDRNWIIKKPKIQKLKEGQNRIRFLTPEEEQAVLNWCDYMAQNELKDLVVVLVDTGMRLNECLGLESRDVDQIQKLIRLSEPSRIKNGMPRCIPMTKRVLEVAQRRALGGRLWSLSGHQADRLWGRMRAQIGLSDDSQFVLHALRHTCASRLVQRGVALKVVQEWLGHKDIITTLRYAHLAPTSLFTAVAVLEPSPAIS